MKHLLQCSLISILLPIATSSIAQVAGIKGASISAGAARLDNGSLVTIGQPLVGVFGTPGAGVSGTAGFVPVMQAFLALPPSPQIAPDFGLLGTNFHLSFQGAAGWSYAVEASTNLLDWTTLWSTNGTDAAVQFTDPDVLRYGRRFYRVVVQ